MKIVGAYEAKTHLSRLLECVAKDEKIVITKRGKPVAILVPCVEEKQRDTAQVVKEMLEYRDRHGPTLGDMTIRELIEEGRRC